MAGGRGRAQNFLLCIICSGFSNLPESEYNTKQYTDHFGIVLLFQYFLVCICSNDLFSGGSAAFLNDF